MSALSMSIGRKLGRLISVFAWGKLKKRLEGKATKAGLILLAALILPAATCVRDFGIGVGIGVVEGVRDCARWPSEPDCRPPARPLPPPCPLAGQGSDPNNWCGCTDRDRVSDQPVERKPCTPDPTPSRPPVVIEPTPTNAPVIIPTATIAPSPTPAPAAGCVPKPPAGPVTLIYRGACPSYMEPLDFEGEGNVNVPGDKKLCAVKAGSGNQRTAWRLGYGLGRQGMRLERFGDVWLQFDSGRGCTDAYGRHFPDCETEYQHPEPGAAYTWGGYTVPVFCEDQPTPAPTAGPTPTPGAPGACPPLHLVQWDVLRIASKVDRSTQPRTGREDNPALATEDIIVGHITPKMLRPYCPNERIICEMAPACQDERVGRPIITQTLPGVFDRDPVVQNSSNAFITFMNLAPGEVGRFEIEACTEWGTHCTTSYVWVR